MEDGPALGSVRAEKLQPTRWMFYPVGYSVFFKPKPKLCVPIHWDFPGGSVSKESAYNAGNAGDSGSIPGSGRHPGEGNGSPLQYSCLENPIDRGAWRATVHRVTESRTGLKRLSIHTPDSLKPTQADIQQKLEANKHYPVSAEAMQP